MPPDFGTQEAKLALPFIEAVKAATGPDDFLYLEERIQIISPNCYGTADAVVWRPKGHELLVFDLKTGKHPVEPDSPQLQLYAAGAYLNFSTAETISTVIVQPIVSPEPQVAEHEPWEILATLERARQAVDKALTREPHYQVGDWCRFCPARPICPAYAAELQTGFDGATVYDDNWE